ncbi:MAG TPA: hypothetical protein VNU68_03665, partial [Verrucomicrobiae bacterium]|nr:hypothetical protein [Verrucomicrobiae bacterium]
DNIADNGLCGILPGLNCCADAPTTPEIVNYFTSGSRIPHKVKLLDCAGNDVTDTVGPLVKVRLEVTQRTGTYKVAVTSTAVPVDYNGVGDVGGYMALIDHHFQYNLNTTGYLKDTDNDGKGSANDAYYFQSCVKVEYLSSPGVVVGQENVILESR